MRTSLATLMLLMCVACAPGAELAFGCIRVVRAQAGEPGKPSITLPSGYRLRSETGSEVAAPGEYHVFISGPSGAAHASISWPGVAIAAVIEDGAYLPLGGDPASGSVSCDIPVRKLTMLDAWSTLDVASYLDEPELAIRVDHDHPARRSGWYLDHSWPAAQATASANWLCAARLILHDWGLPHQIAAAGVGHLSLLGFEAVNPMHLDYPPHWHLIDYWPGEAGSLIPHYYMDGRGALWQDKVQVLDRQDQVPDRYLGPGQPLIIPDPSGATRFATRIRADGGLDLGPDDGQWRYAIVAGDDGTFMKSVHVLRDGRPFATVAASDDVAFGVLTIHTILAGGSSPPDEVHAYDPLTGRPRTGAAAAAPAYGMRDPNAIVPAAREPTPSRVVVAVMENHAYGEIIGSPDAPYINSLAQSGALFTQSFASTHPSQPNYLILFSGSDQGVTDDNVPPRGAPFTTPNLGAELLQSGRGFVGYSEDLPSVGYLGGLSGRYVRRHAPWTNWQGASVNAIPAAASQPFSAFPSDYSALPTVSFVIPDLDHDMHDGSIAAGDRWLHDHLDGFVQWARANHGLLILTFDEDDGSAGNRIATIFVGGDARVGSYDQVIGHADVLRTIEAMYGLPGAGAGGAAIDGWSTASGDSSKKRCGVGALALLLGLLLVRRR